MTPSLAEQPGRRRLGDVLVNRGVLTSDELQEALSHQVRLAEEGRRVRLGQVVTELGLASERDIAVAMADLLGLDVVDLGTETIAPETVRLLPRTVAERTQVLVLGKIGSKLRVASADPTNVVALDDVKIYTGATDLVVVVAVRSQLFDHLARAWSLSEASDGEVTTMFESDTERDESDVDNARIVRMVASILADAVHMRASDVHFEPQQGDVRIRYRIDGLLRDIMHLPRGSAASLVSRLKIISGLDIAERRVPQDGRARITVDKMSVDARFSTMPSVHGEKAVVRLLAAAEQLTPLMHVGLDERQLDDLVAALLAPQGLILITGPTGAGKTNTLYAAINQIRTPERNIVTLEDPVEIQLPGITQVPVHERSGMTFSRGLRAVLRQDPDVILVGEARDTETAELAMQAAMTGHLVLTTLHTNDAVSSITRLVDMGVEPYLIATSLSCVVAQRLVRKPCPSCAQPYEPTPRVLAQLGLKNEDLAQATPMRGRGCGDCGNTGYRGRTGVFEVVPVTAGLRAVLTKSPSEAAIAAAARAAGVTTLRRAAIMTALRGDTTFEEVLRVSQADSLGSSSCPGCSRRLADDMVVCPWCDIALGRGHCVSCARPLDPEWTVCPWCRAAAPIAPAPIRAARRDLPHVLIVDDDPSVCAFVAAALEGNAIVDEAADGTTGLRLAQEGDYDVAVIDHRLPDLSGIELIRLLRNDVGTAGLPLLMFTGIDAHAIESDARHAGADGFLGKPVDPATLQEHVLALAARSHALPSTG